MHSEPYDGNAVPATGETGRSGADSSALRWQDGLGRSWQVSLDSDRIVLRHDQEVVELPKSTWARDVSIAPHGSGFIIRFSTFQTELGFVVPGQQAIPFIEHVSKSARRTEQSEANDAIEPSVESLLWPKVSPLAVGALLCSSMTFLPFVGLIPAAVTVALLFLHRKNVRHSRSWAHSRAVCASATVFLAVGLIVSLLAIWSAAGTRDQRFRSYENARASTIHYQRVIPAARDTKQLTAASAPKRAGFLTSGGAREYNWGLIGAALVVVLMSLTVHEAAHAITALWLGDDFARRLGRVTLNPLAHIDPFGTVVLPLLLAIAGWGVFGWARPVPVRTEVLSRPRRGHILISLAGPVSNLLMAAASLSLLLGLGCAVALLAPRAMVSNYALGSFTAGVEASGFALASLFGPLCTILKLTFMINLLLAFFNLIPIPPLDGSWVLGHLFPRTVGRLYESIRPYAFLIFLLVLWSDYFIYLLWPAFISMHAGFELLSYCTPF